MQANEEAQRDELFGQASAPKSGRVNIEERRRQRAAAQRSAANRIGEGLAGEFDLRWNCSLQIFSLFCS